ncbi:MAG: flagellar motor protein MotB [Thermoguttaceae bacterium]
MRDFLEEKPEGAPEWMVSYADMITIIMSFFVVMFSIASGEAAKGKRSQQQQAAIESLQYRFGPKWKPFMSWSLMPGNSMLPGGGKGLGSPALTPAVGDPGGTVRVLKMEKARIRVPGQGDQIAIGGMVYFDKATVDLVAGQSGSIQKIADELAGKPQQVEIVATASNQPLPPGSSFRDRWELSYARCRQTAGLLTSLKIEPERLRLSVLPANVQDNKAALSSEADVAVRVYLSTTLPTAVK